MFHQEQCIIYIYVYVIYVYTYFFAGTGTASIRVKDINDMPPQFTKEEWFTEVDETEGPDLPEMPILTVTVHDEDETNKFQYKVEYVTARYFETIFSNDSCCIYNKLHFL